MSGGKPGLTSPAFVLVVIEFVFSLILLGLSAYIVDQTAGLLSKVNFTLFVALTSMLLCGFFIALNFASHMRTRIIMIIELVLVSVYWVFWLAAAACMADVTRVVNDVWFGWRGTTVDTIRAACAFAWLTFFLWCGSLALSIMNIVMKGAVFKAPTPEAGPSVGAAEKTAAPPVSAKV